MTTSWRNGDGEGGDRAEEEEGKKGEGQHAGEKKTEGGGVFQICQFFFYKYNKSQPHK